MANANYIYVSTECQIYALHAFSLIYLGPILNLLLFNIVLTRLRIQKDYHIYFTEYKYHNYVML